MVKNIIEWFKKGSNLIDILMLLGLIIIVLNTFYINVFIGFYLLGALLIIIPFLYYKLIKKGGE